ncbi:MAG: S41 family peptidase [Myxococcota bacterium]
MRKTTSRRGCSLTHFFDDGGSDGGNASDAVKRAIDGLRSQGIDSLLLDLRGNPGGLLTETAEVGGLFIDHGPVVASRDSSGKIQIYEDNEPGEYYDGPMGVFVDQDSASAAEILPAMLQDYGRAIVIGETTFGKGTVQKTNPLYSRDGKQNYGTLNLTIEAFYRVTGKSTQEVGVTPDVRIEMSDNTIPYGERTRDNVLELKTIDALDFEKVNRVPDLTKYLQKRQRQIPQHKEKGVGGSVRTSKNPKKLTFQERANSDAYLQEAAKILTEVTDLATELPH